MTAVQILNRITSVFTAASSPRQLGAAVVLGMCIGLNPSLVFDILFLILLILFNVNFLTGIIATVLFRIIAMIIAPLLHLTGFQVLVNASFLRPLWTLLYNTPFIPFTAYNNTVIMGSLVFSLVLAYPVYHLTKSISWIIRDRFARGT